MIEVSNKKGYKLIVSNILLIKGGNHMSTIVHFDIVADNPQRAKKFYEALFGRKIEGPPGMADYFLIDTGDFEGNKSVGGGLGMRRNPAQKITNYIGVDNIEEYSKKVEELGGEVISPKLIVSGWGYLTICHDTEGNIFGLWQDDKDAIMEV